MRNTIAMSLVLMLAAFGGACGDGDDGKAVERGVGEDCVTTADCRNDESAGEDAVDAPPLLECLTEFKGGYCGLTGCAAHEDCPEGSLCVVADNGTNYCFLECVDKADCNAYRAAEVEANCSASVTMVDGAKTSKVCVPPTAN